MDEGELRERLAFDLQLNAQGLCVWQKRLQRHLSGTASELANRVRDYAAQVLNAAAL